MAKHFGGFDPKSRNDSFGFTRPEEFDVEHYEAFVSEYLPILSRRSKRWSELVPEAADGISLQLPKSGQFTARKWKRFIRKGIPSSLRPKIWLAISGAEDRMIKFPTEFRRLAKQQPTEEVLCAIEKDLYRTFPDNHYFRDMPGSLRDELKHILTAFANRNPHIGYCQGQNYLAAMLLLVVKNSEQAFWLLQTMIMELPDYYTRDMFGLRVDMGILNELIRERIPELSQKFAHVGFDPAVVMTKWFVIWYLETLPIETVLRIWDCLFNEGHKILIRVALTLLMKHKDQLLQCETFLDVVNQCEAMVTGDYALRCHTFLEDIFTVTGSFSRKTIEQLKVKVEAELRLQ